MVNKDVQPEDIAKSIALTLGVRTITFSGPYLSMPEVRIKPMHIAVKKPKVDITLDSILKCLISVKPAVIGVIAPRGHVLVMSDLFPI